MIERITIIFLCVAVSNSCGTVAGNPRKPTTEDPPTQLVELYKLPTINMDLGDATLEDSSLLLTAEGGAADKRVFNTYGRRFNQLLREINETSKRINDLAASNAEADTEQTIRVRGQGSDERLVARIGPSATEFDYEAVLCANDQPLQLLRWTQDAGAIELWRDFSISRGTNGPSYSMTSAIKVEISEAGDIMLDMSSLGIWDDSDADISELASTVGLAEKTYATRFNTDGIIELRSVADRYSGEVPAAFDGDRYLVGRLYPRSSGQSGYDATFIGYSNAANRLLCQAGFDEEAPDLWHPDAAGPRFCLARQQSGARFDNFAEFADFVATFSDVGIASKQEIEVVEMPAGLSCL